MNKKTNIRGLIITALFTVALIIVAANSDQQRHVQVQHVTENKSVKTTEITTKTEDTIAADEEVLPKNAKIYMKYEFFGDGKYNIYRAGNKYFLCYRKQVLTSTIVDENLKATHYKKCALWPYAYSKEHSLYIIQAKLDQQQPQLDFIKVAENCKDAGYADNYIVKLPIYKEKSSKRYFVVMPEDTDSYRNYASIVDDKQIGTYNSEFECIELTEDTVDANLSWGNDALSWSARFFIEYYGDEFYITSQLCNKVTKNYLNLIIRDTDSESEKLLRLFETTVSYKDLDFYIEKIQEFLSQWEKENPEKIVQYYKDNPDWIDVDLSNPKSGLQNWLDANPTYAAELIK